MWVTRAVGVRTIVSRTKRVPVKTFYRLGEFFGTARTCQPATQTLVESRGKKFFTRLDVYPPPWSWSRSNSMLTFSLSCPWYISSDFYEDPYISILPDACYPEIYIIDPGGGNIRGIQSDCLLTLYFSLGFILVFHLEYNNALRLFVFHLINIFKWVPIFHFLLI